jgi:hypothetical protein
VQRCQQVGPSISSMIRPGSVLQRAEIGAKSGRGLSQLRVCAYSVSLALPSARHSRGSAWRRALELGSCVAEQMSALSQPSTGAGRFLFSGNTRLAALDSRARVRRGDGVRHVRCRALVRTKGISWLVRSFGASWSPAYRLCLRPMPNPDSAMGHPFASAGEP